MFIHFNFLSAFTLTSSLLLDYSVVTPALTFYYCSNISAHPLPVVGGQMPDLVLWDELLQDLRNIVEVGFIFLKLHPVDQRRQLVHLLLQTLVVASQILGQLLERDDRPLR